MPKEQWVKIKNFEEYEVSSLGRIRSLPKRVRYVHAVTGKEYFRNTNEKLLKVGLCKGYEYIHLGRAGKNKKVHRLVADAFHDNPLGLPDVNHKDGNKRNNCIDNLEWVSKEDNSRHAKENNLTSKGKVLIAFKDNDAILFGSRRFAIRYGFSSSAIGNVLAGLSKTHGGYEWAYANGDD